LILVCELMWEEGLDLLRAEAPTLYDPDLGGRREHLLRRAADAEALIVRNATWVDRELLGAARRLKVVGRLGVGLDNIDLDAASRAGVRVVFAPGVNSVATAEFALGLCLSLARHIPAAGAAGAKGVWERRGLAGRELAGCVLGVLGLGRTGTQVARAARALGMEVWSHNPHRPLDDAEARHAGVRPVGFEELLRGADFVSLHLPLTAETRGLIGPRQLALFRPDAYLINTARGGLVDEPALARALREGWLAGAALDVRAIEPPPDPDPLAGVPNLLLTPHVAGLTEEAQRLTSTRVARDVLRVLRGEPMPQRPSVRRSRRSKSVFSTIMPRRPIRIMPATTSSLRSCQRALSMKNPRPLPEPMISAPIRTRQPTP
jgi:D-3-phosphoglycerate dehydrogenase